MLAFEEALIGAASSEAIVLESYNAPGVAPDPRAATMRRLVGEGPGLVRE